VTTTDLDTEGSEEALLAAAWDRLSTVDGIVTFNGIGFDWRWLMIRSAILRVKPSRVFHAVRYRHWPVCDIMAILADWQPDKWRKLGEWCRVFGVRCEGKEAGIDGSQVWPMIQRGEWGAVRDYCAGDVRATWRLYRVLEEYGIVMPMPEVGK
jgi:predicted PolB exonuclease-like 3'-5' exonuclease